MFFACGSQVAAPSPHLSPKPLKKNATARFHLVSKTSSQSSRGLWSSVCESTEQKWESGASVSKAHPCCHAFALLGVLGWGKLLVRRLRMNSLVPGPALSFDVEVYYSRAIKEALWFPRTIQIETALKRSICAPKGVNIT